MSAPHCHVCTFRGQPAAGCPATLTRPPNGVPSTGGCNGVQHDRILQGTSLRGALRTQVSRPEYDSHTR